MSRGKDTCVEAGRDLFHLWVGVPDFEEIREDELEIGKLDLRVNHVHFERKRTAIHQMLRAEVVAQAPVEVHLDRAVIVAHVRLTSIRRLMIQLSLNTSV